MFKTWHAVVVAAFVVLCARTASAAPVAYEGFVYAPGPLPGNNGGLGFAPPWAGDVGVTVQGGGSLMHPLALPSSGLLIGGQFNVNRQLIGPIGPPIFWTSFLVQAAPGNDQVWLGLDSAPTQFPFITFGRRLSNYFIQNLNNAPLNVCCGSAAGVTDLLITRITRSGVSTLVDLWINTNPDVTPPTLSAVLPPAPPLQVVNMQVETGWLADEVRIGTNLQDVAAAAASVPIPPWAVGAIGLLLAVVGLGCVRRTRRPTGSVA
jgi:hypothetical protein